MMGAMSRRINLLVLAGGRSAERDVSCISAAFILRSADPRLYRLSAVHIDAKGRWTLLDKPSDFARHPKPWLFPFRGRPLSIELGASSWLRAGGGSVAVDVVFPALHGPMGEDGTVQGLLELAGTAYVGCDVLGSSCAMDKEATKRLALQAGIPVLPYRILRSPKEAGSVRGLRYPVFVKPCRLGSSVGVYKVRRPGDLAAAARKAFRYDTAVIVEQGIAARELECALLGDYRGVKASIVGEVRPNAEYYTYEAKYLDPNGAELFVPAPISRAATARLQDLAKTAFRALGLYGLARLDFLMDKETGRLYFNEANTLPGFTPGSLYPKLWAESGLPVPRLIDRLVGLAVARQKARARLSLAPV